MYKFWCSCLFLCMKFIEFDRKKWFLDFNELSSFYIIVIVISYEGVLLGIVNLYS